MDLSAIDALGSRRASWRGAAAIIRRTGAVPRTKSYLRYLQPLLLFGPGNENRPTGRVEPGSTASAVVSFPFISRRKYGRTTNSLDHHGRFCSRVFDFAIFVGMPEANNRKWVRLAEDVGLPEALREKTPKSGEQDTSAG